MIVNHVSASIVAEKLSHAEITRVGKLAFAKVSATKIRAAVATAANRRCRASNRQILRSRTSIEARVLIGVHLLPLRKRLEQFNLNLLRLEQALVLAAQQVIHFFVQMPDFEFGLE